MRCVGLHKIRFQMTNVKRVITRTDRQIVYNGFRKSNVVIILKLKKVLQVMQLLNWQGLLENCVVCIKAERSKGLKVSLESITDRVERFVLGQIFKIILKMKPE